MIKIKMLAGGFNCGKRMTQNETTKLELSVSNRDKRLKISYNSLGNLHNSDASYSVYIPRILGEKEESIQGKNGSFQNWWKAWTKHKPYFNIISKNFSKYSLMELSPRYSTIKLLKVTMEKNILNLVRGKWSVTQKTAVFVSEIMEVRKSGTFFKSWKKTVVNLYSHVWLKILLRKRENADIL